MLALQIKRVILTILFALILCGAVTASNGQKLNKEKPGVFISFGEFVKKTADGREGLKLVLHNNTRWPIYYEKNYDPTVGAGSIIYVIELENGERDVMTRINVVSKGKVLPGKTLSFVIPRTDFPRGSKVYVEFNFAWELIEGETVRDEVVHRACFLTSKLPHPR